MERGLIVKNSRWILHDYMQVNGGAERLVVTLTNGLPGFSLWVSGIYPDYLEFSRFDSVGFWFTTGFISRLPRIPRAIITFTRSLPFLRSAENVIYSGIYAPLAVRQQNKGKRIYYCHTPPRFAFNEEDKYLQRLPKIIRPLLRFAIGFYRYSYLGALSHMDVIITNSHHVRRRLLNQTGFDSIVVYPPIDIDRFRYRSQDDFYLSVGRLESPKRVELIVRAFINMPEKNLLVTSGGSQFDRLKNLANSAPNIRFSGWVSDEILIDYVGRAIAVIYIPSDEDFGMSAVEAMAAGKAVIGVAEGGLCESIIHGQTGILLPPDPTTEDVILAVKKMTPEIALTMRKACEDRARIFSIENFLLKIRGLLL